MPDHGPIYLLLYAAVTCVLIEASTALNAFTHQVYLQENTATGTIIADVAEITETRPIRPAKRNYKLLSETLLSNAGSHPRGGSWMQLDETQGVVTLRRPLDREEACGTSLLCTIQLKIYIHSTLQMFDLGVVVVDENEHAPEFPVKYIVVNVSEEARIGDVINLDPYLARDEDAGNNSVVTYSLSSSEHFGLVQSSDETGSRHLQIQVLRRLDYEVKRLYRMTLRAADAGSPQMSNQVPLQVRVTDENDNSPIFDKQEYSVMIQENAQPGHVITQIKARDADSGKAGEIRYYLANRNPDFIGSLIGVNERTGEVFIKGELDRETSDKNIIYVEARDLGKPVQRMGRSRVLLYIGDVNDNRPVISVTYIAPSVDNTVYISESSTFKTAFAYVNAKDADSESNGEVTISVKTMLPEDWNTEADTSRLKNSEDFVADTFSLNEKNFLEVNRDLDRETLSRYKLVVKGCDKGVNELCSEKVIHVVILDENDHAPEFERPTINVSLSEGAALGTVVETVRAVDGDAVDPTSLAKDKNDKIVASKHGHITYSIAGGGGCFSVDPKAGTVTLVRPLDRERTPRWEVVVTATDGGDKALHSKCRIRIDVLDVNDNAPVFTNPVEDDSTSYASILRQEVITRIQAVDYDEGANSKLKFEILAEDGIKQTGFVNGSLFILNSTNGDLRLNMSNHRLRNSLGRHSLLVQVQDAGLPTKMNQRAMWVVITNRAVLPNADGSGFVLAGADSSFILIVVSLASLVILLVLITVIIVCICRKRNKKRQNTEIKKNDESKRNSLTNVNEKIPALVKSPSKESLSKESVSWSQDSHKRRNSIAYDSTTELTNLSRSDAVLSRQFPVSGASLERQDASKCGLAVGTQNAAESTLSVLNQDEDSGHGGSEPDGLSGDVMLQRPYGGQKILSGSRPAEKNYLGLGPQCNEQCYSLGHSDTCWMPAASCGLAPSNDPFRAINSFPETRAPTSETLDKPTNLETIPETHQVHRLWTHLESQSSMSSVYSNILPKTFGTQDYLDQRKTLPENRFSGKLWSDRDHSTSDSTTTGYVTEPEII